MSDIKQQFKESIFGEIEKCIIEERENVANAALARMSTYLILLRNNHKLIEPHTTEEIAGWLTDDMAEFKKRFIKG